MPTPVLYPALLPPIAYMAWVAHEGAVWNTMAPFDKRSWRNRYRIYGPHGPQDLSAPIVKESLGGPLREVRLEHRGNWAEKEWRAIESSYRKASFFEALADELYAIISTEHDFLIDRIEESMNWVCESLRIDKVEDSNERTWNLKPIKPSADVPGVEYRQVFAHVGGFRSHLSILDLLMNEGPLSYDILKDQASLFPASRIQP